MYALVNAGALKAARKAALAHALHGPPPQTRDEHARFSGFDGGARQPPPLPRDPVADHDQLVTTLAAYSKLGRSGF